MTCYVAERTPPEGWFTKFLDKGRTVIENGVTVVCIRNVFIRESIDGS